MGKSESYSDEEELQHQISQLEDRISELESDLELAKSDNDDLEKDLEAMTSERDSAIEDATNNKMEVEEREKEIYSNHDDYMNIYYNSTGEDDGAIYDLLAEIRTIKLSNKEELVEYKEILEEKISNILEKFVHTTHVFFDSSVSFRTSDYIDPIDEEQIENVLTNITQNIFDIQNELNSRLRHFDLDIDNGLVIDLFQEIYFVHRDLFSVFIAKKTTANYLSTLKNTIFYPQAFIDELKQSDYDSFNNFVDAVLHKCTDVCYDQNALSHRYYNYSSFRQHSDVIRRLYRFSVYEGINNNRYVDTEESIEDFRNATVHQRDSVHGDYDLEYENYYEYRPKYSYELVTREDKNTVPSTNNRKLDPYNINKWLLTNYFLQKYKKIRQHVSLDSIKDFVKNDSVTKAFMEIPSNFYSKYFKDEFSQYSNNVHESFESIKTDLLKGDNGAKNVKNFFIIINSLSSSLLNVMNRDTIINYDSKVKLLIAAIHSYRDILEYKPASVSEDDVLYLEEMMDLILSYVFNMFTQFMKCIKVMAENNDSDTTAGNSYIAVFKSVMINKDIRELIKKPLMENYKREYNKMKLMYNQLT